MQKTIMGRAAVLAVAAMLGLSGQVLAQETKATADAHDHAHDHDHDHDHQAKDRVAEGYFDDNAVQARMLADWAGDWQSVYPYLVDGTLDPVMAHKAESGDKSADEYRDYYDVGYQTQTDRILIADDSVEFFAGDGSVKGVYQSDGQEILTYAKGNRGVRYVFAKVSGDDAAPDYIQFSDHIIAPQKSDHYHLYWGDDRAALLDEVTNWPTYYPADLSGEQIVAEMLAH